MSTKFFDYESTFEVQDMKDENIPKKKTNIFKLVKSILINVLKMVATFLLLRAYLTVLGAEESQSLKYQSSLSFSYDAEDIPRLFPVHQLLAFDIEAVKNRMKCLIF